MGLVYRALDRESGNVVALKTRTLRHSMQRERFLREAGVLAELTHPAIVRYVDHGVQPDGQCYLAMEWLEGENLRARIGRRGLTVDESVALLRRAAEGVGELHAHGWVHRDLKPSNLFLVDKDPYQVKVLDFGVVRQIGSFTPGTDTGAMVGTLGYLAPEQARGDREIDWRADLFALGCVLFECLTGRPAFLGPQPGAVLGRILFGPTPQVCSVRSAVSPALDSLVGSLLAKDPSDRPFDVAALLEAFDHLGLLTEGELPASVLRETTLTGAEQRLRSIMLFAAVKGEAPSVVAQRELFCDRLVVLGGRAAPLVDGSVLVQLDGKGTARDQAARVASFARAISAEQELRVALATGPSALGEQVTTGEALDRAAAVLAAGDSPGVFLDDVTAGLLDGPYEVADVGGQLALVSDHRDGAVRLLLGRPTPCLGRSKELAYLVGVFEEAFEDEAAGAVIVVGAAGVGKSRLLHELIERVRRREDVRIFSARGETISAEAPFAVVAQLVRRVLGLRKGDDLVGQYKSMGEALSVWFEGESLRRVTDFLGRLIHVPSPEPLSPLLQAARHDGRVESEQVKAAFTEWLEALCREGPTVLVIDDLHFCDLPSITLIGHALRKLADAPLVVLAAARRSVAEIFPGFWNDVGSEGITLGPLKRPAAQRLVRGILGREVTDERVHQIISTARGNAFFLEELIRHAAEGGRGELPETVLAMVQSRLEGLESSARLTLRAGSIFGETFWEGGVRTLTGVALDPLIAGIAGGSAALTLGMAERWEESKSRAIDALELSASMPLVQTGILAALATAQLALGNIDAAASACREARNHQACSGAVATVDTLLVVAEIGLLTARGRDVEACQVAEDAREKLLARVVAIADPAASEAMLSRVKANRLLLARVEELGAER